MPRTTYELRLYNKVLLEFALKENGIHGLTADIQFISGDNRHLLPLDMETTNQSLIKWLQRRVIPKNRAFVGEILRTLGLTMNDTKGIIDVCRGLSLTDSYWVVPSGFTGTFEEYNLFENPFSEVLSLVAYTGVSESDKAFTTSPELTTNGALPKAWRYLKNDGIYLYKGATSGAANTGKEPYSEFYAYQVAKAMGLDAVEYGLENWKGILASTCRLFTSPDVSFVPVGRVMPGEGLAGCLDFYWQLGPEFYDQLCSMLTFDAVVYNEDRHFGNFGLLRDNRTGDLIAPAPIFDNGNALFHFAMPGDFTDLSSYAKTLAPAYGNISFEAVCREVTGRKQVQQLRKLIGFKFQRHPTLNLPEDWLCAMEDHLQSRVRELLELTRSRNRGRQER